jgi:putative FmdB family regulatory protein
VPTYQYACTECGHAFEQFQSFTDDALTVCPVCEGRLRKVFNAVGVVFKGSGFYRTDSRAPDKDGAKAPAAQTASADGSGKESNKEAAASTSSGSSSKDGGTAAASSSTTGSSTASAKGSSAA